MKKQRYILALFYFLSCSSFAQQPYSFEEERAKEDYSFLKDSTKRSWKKAIFQFTSTLSLLF